MGLSPDHVEQFQSKVELIPFSECHYWTGQLNDQGYGLLNRTRAHRISFEIANGREPQGEVLHSCDNRMCVNPAHLREGSQTENMKDAQLRQRFPLGEQHHKAKLTAADVAEIMRLSNEGAQTGDLAKQFGVSPSRISTIRHGNVGPNHPAYGVNRPTGRTDRRMSDERVLLLYRRAAAGESPTKLADEFGVTYSFVQDVKRGNTYARVTGRRS